MIPAGASILGAFADHNVIRSSRRNATRPATSDAGFRAALVSALTHPSISVTLIDTLIRFRGARAADIAKRRNIFRQSTIRLEYQ